MSEEITPLNAPHDGKTRLFRNEVFDLFVTGGQMVPMNPRTISIIDFVTQVDDNWSCLDENELRESIEKYGEFKLCDEL